MFYPVIWQTKYYTNIQKQTKLIFFTFHVLIFLDSKLDDKNSGSKESGHFLNLIRS